MSTPDSSWLRQLAFVVGDASGKGLDLSGLRVRFTVTSASVQTLKRLEARIYNLSGAHAKQIQNQFTQVLLQVNYENQPAAVIFAGTICQIGIGRENATDSFVDIVAADGDIPYNWATVNQTIAAGWTPITVQNALDTSLQHFGVSMGASPSLSQNGAPRGRVLYGMTRDELRQFSNSNGLWWTLENGTLDFQKQLGYIPGGHVVVSSATGMIGIPTQTADGVVVRTLLNPQIRTGRLLQIDNASISQTDIRTVASPSDIPFLPSLDNDGLYIAYHVVHFGDTRGNEWYTDSICTALTGTTPISGTYTTAVIDGN